jgi:nucleotide-binding universal stress UspA family protein
MAAKLAERTVAALQEQGVIATSDIRNGPPAPEILKRAAADPWDLIVLGSHGQSRLTQFLIGRVSQNVAKHVDCSALVVRAGQPWSNQ